MDSTVQPDRKLMADTVSKWSRSSTGLMMTPPPMPQIAPTALAPRATRKNISMESPRFQQVLRPAQAGRA